MKQEYDVVKELQGLSGFRWDATLCTVTAEPDVWSTYIKVSSGGMWHPQRTHEYVKMRPKRGPWSQRIQGDCRGGYKTLIWWILLYYSPAEEDIRLRVLFPSSAGYNNLTKLLPKEETQLGDCTVTNEQNAKNSTKSNIWSNGKGTLCQTISGLTEMTCTQMKCFRSSRDKGQKLFHI